MKRKAYLGTGLRFSETARSAAGMWQKGSTRIPQEQVRHERGQGNGGCDFYSQVKSLMDGKRMLVKGLNGRKGSYDAYFIPEKIKVAHRSKRC